MLRQVHVWKPAQNMIVGNNCKMRLAYVHSLPIPVFPLCHRMTCLLPYSPLTTTSGLCLHQIYSLTRLFCMNFACFLSRPASLAHEAHFPHPHAPLPSFTWFLFQDCFPCSQSPLLTHKPRPCPEGPLPSQTCPASLTHKPCFLLGSSNCCCGNYHICKMNNDNAVVADTLIVG